MKVTQILIAVLCLVILSGCASSTPPQLRAVAKSGCDLSKQLEGPVTTARSAAIALWNVERPDGTPVLSDEAKEALLRIDSKLLEFKRSGQVACAIADGVFSPSGVDWTQAVGVVLDVAIDVAKAYAATR